MKEKINKKSLILIPIDMACIFAAYVVAAYLRADDLMAELKFFASMKDNALEVIFNPAAIVIVVIYIVCFALFDMYSTLLTHMTLEDAFKVAGGNFVAIAVSVIYNYTLFPIFSGLEGNETMERIPTGIVVISGVIIFMLTMGLRVLPRLFSEFRSNYYTKNKRRVLIYGAGNTGVTLLKELSRPSSKRSVVAFYDESEEKIGQKISGLRIYGKKNGLQDTIKALGVAEVIVAVPSMKPSKLHEIVNLCKDVQCDIKRIPAISDMMLEENTKLSSLREIDIADLLGRDEAVLDVDKISGYIKGSVVMVTGGGGSIGSELCRQIMKYGPKKLVILDIYENNAYELENELKQTYGRTAPVETRIASVRDYRRMTIVFDEIMPDVVFHAAAHKHVPLMEFSPGEAIKNNIFGTYNTATVAHEHKVKTFVLISTDKAVNPTNIMGATKRVAEIIIQAYSKFSGTRFVAVRFGNVLGSNGSVIPLFKKQIAAMGPVTVTDPNITRFFMTIPEASRLVIQAGAMAKGGEIFILDMGEPVKIDSLARDLIKLSGYEPDVDIKIVYTGLRPGEKIYEELLRAEEGVTVCEKEGFFVAKPFIMEWEEVQKMMKDFEECIDMPHEAVAKTLKKYVPTYKSEDFKGTEADK